MSNKTKSRTIIFLLLDIFILSVWCGYFKRVALIFTSGLMLFGIQLICLLFFLLKKDVNFGLNRQCKNAFFSFCVFSFIYIIVFLFDGGVNSKVDILGIVSVSKQVYGAVFDLIFVGGILFFLKKINEAEKREICKLFWFIVITMSIFNAISVSLNPELTKTEADSVEVVADSFESIFVLGYSNSYWFVLLTPVVLYKIGNSNGGSKIFFIVVFCSMLLSVYMAAYLIALTTMILAIITYFVVLHSKSTMAKVLFALFSIAFVYCFLMGKMNKFLIYLADATDNDFIEGRLREIVDFLEKGWGSAVEGKTTYRFYMYKYTFEHFLHHPLLGNYFFGQYNCSFDHATLLDLLSCGGLLLAIPFLLFLRLCYKYGASLLKERKKQKVLLVSFICYIYLTLCNSVVSYMYILLLFFIEPILLNAGEKHENINSPSL